MKALITIIFCFLSLILLAQHDSNKDYYITKRGDTVYGKIFVGLKNVLFTYPSGKKMKLHPDSVLSYTYYEGGASVPAAEINKYYTTVLSLESKFFDIYYKCNGPVKILFEDKINIVFGLGLPMPADDDLYYFEKNGVLTLFHAARFYAAALKYMADCPDMAEYLDHVPNGKNTTKTHKAKMGDAPFIISKYNECLKH